MNARLHWVTLIAGILTAFIGTWGFIESFSLATAELQDMQFWPSLALVFAGVGILTAGADRLRTR